VANITICESEQENLPNASLIDGKAMAESLRLETAARAVAFRVRRGYPPGLAVILVGAHSASQMYVRNKIKKAQDSGIESFPHFLEESTSEEEVLALIQKLNEDRFVHGILVQLPLPAHIDESKIVSALSPSKDVDGFHPINVGLLAQGHSRFVPCTPQGCMTMLKHHYGDLQGAKVVVVGRSNIVGKPMAALLTQANCTVTLAHSHTKNLEAECRQADIVIVAVGRPGFLSAAAIKPGAIVIDVGINRVEVDGIVKLVGDVDQQSVMRVASAIAPVPGGVGPMTVACLMKNTLSAAEEIEGDAYGRLTG